MCLFLLLLGGCHLVCCILLARADGWSLWKGTTNEVLQQDGEHSKCSPEWGHDSLPQLLRIKVDPHVAGQSQPRLHSQVLKRVPVSVLCVCSLVVCMKTCRKTATMEAIFLSHWESSATSFCFKDFSRSWARFCNPSTPLLFALFKFLTGIFRFWVWYRTRKRISVGCEIWGCESTDRVSVLADVGMLFVL